MYSDAIMVPFFVVARTILVLTALARVWDEKISSIAPPTSHRQPEGELLATWWSAGN
jgi:hypothetical protein